MVSGGETMTLKEIKIELIGIDKTMTWLAQQLGYSTTYLYLVISEQNQKELDRIAEILKGGK